MAGQRVIQHLEEGDPCPECGAPLRIERGAKIRRVGVACMTFPIVLLLSLLKWPPGFGGSEADRVNGRDVHRVECTECYTMSDVAVKNWLGPGRL